MPRNRSRQIVHVFADGKLKFLSRTIDCSLGAGGITTAKREGDGATPSGLFPVRSVWLRPDRTSFRPKLAWQPIGRCHGWCDDPGSAAYNRPVRLPFGGSHECLLREDRLYDIVLVIGHNDRPARAGLGSAIFVHVMPPRRGATAGCIAPARPDLVWLLSFLRAGDMVKVHAPDRKSPRFPPRRVLP